MFPSCSRSLRLSVMNKLIKMTFMDLIFDTNTHKKFFSLVQASFLLLFLILIRLLSQFLYNITFKELHSSSTANLSDSLRLSSCVFGLWNPDEKKERERERSSKSHVLRNYESHQTMHGSISLSKWMTWKTSSKALGESAARLRVDWTPREISAAEMEM